MVHRTVGCLLFCAGISCGDSDGAGAASSSSSSASGGSSSSATGAGGSGAATGGEGGAGGGFGGAGGFVQTPVVELPGLESITFWERTGGEAPTPYEFLVDGLELTVRLPDPMTDTSRDIPGAMGEFYDVYYSNEAGEFQLDGSYLTISGVFPQPLPAGGGLNLAEIGLNFADASTEYGNYLASYVVLGDNASEATVLACIDGDLQTHTTMGNTVGATERLRLTLGFESTSGPPE